MKGQGLLAISPVIGKPLQPFQARASGPPGSSWSWIGHLLLRFALKQNKIIGTRWRLIPGRCAQGLGAATHAGVSFGSAFRAAQFIQDVKACFTQLLASLFSLLASVANLWHLTGVSVTEFRERSPVSPVLQAVPLARGALSRGVSACSSGSSHPENNTSPLGWCTGAPGCVLPEVKSPRSLFFSSSANEGLVPGARGSALRNGVCGQRREQPLAGPDLSARTRSAQFSWAGPRALLWAGIPRTRKLWFVFCYKTRAFFPPGPPVASKGAGQGGEGPHGALLVPPSPHFLLGPPIPSRD